MALPRAQFSRSMLRTYTVLAALLTLLLLLPSGSADAKMHVSERRYWQQQARKMFYHGYHNYMEHAFPWDELKPLSCEGRRWDQRERGDLDDVLGGFSLTLIDSLDMLAIVGDRDEFARAVQRVIDHVSFDRDVTVSVFESTIRVVGGLVSAHMLASPVHLGILAPHEYNGELLALAVDLATRLLPAFDTPTGLPVHRVNLRHGVVPGTPTLTCPAAAGSLLVELSYLSRLSGLSVFEAKARDAVLALWRRRSDLDLLGSAIDVVSGDWIHSHVGIGAGLDSFVEYLLKYHVVSGNRAWLDMFTASYKAVETHVKQPNDVHIEVDMHAGRRVVRSQRVSALQAFWPGLQVLAGDVASAIRSHAPLVQLYDKFGAMPELVDLADRGGRVVSWATTSPLRPELIESAYHLYQATRDDKYLKLGRRILRDIERVSRVACGYAAVGNIHTLAVEDRMDSFFLAETVKYLYLLFSDDVDVIVPSLPIAQAPVSSNAAAARNTSKVVAAVADATAGYCNSGINSINNCGINSINNCGINSISCGINSISINSSTADTPQSCTLPHKQQTTRPLKSSQVVFSTEGHVLMLDATLFARDATSKPTSGVCTNANARSTGDSTDKSSSTSSSTSQMPAPTSAPATASALAYVPQQIGVAVRLGDNHVATLVAWPAAFGQRVDTLTQVEAPLQLFSHSIGDACSTITATDAAQLAGSIVVVTRGRCSFAAKALRLQRAGAAGVVIVNHKTATAQFPSRTYVLTDDWRGLGKRVTIPVMLVAREDTAQLHERVARLRDGDSVANAAATKADQSDDTEVSLSLVATLSSWRH